MKRENNKGNGYLPYFLAAILLLYILVVLFAGIWNCRVHRHIMVKDIDKRLRDGAVAAEIIITDDFHDRAVGPGAISPAEDRENIEKLSKLADEMEFEFVYTFIEKDGEYYLTSSSAKPEELASGQEVQYWEEYGSLEPQVKEAFKSDKPSYLFHSDKWGAYRSVIMPMQTASGHRYAVMADYSIGYIDSAIGSVMNRSVSMMAGMLLMAIPFVTLIWYSGFRHKRRLSEELKEHERLEESLKLWRRATDETRDAVIIAKRVDTFEHPLIYANRAFEEITGYSVEEAEGKDCRYLQREDRNQPGVDEIRKALLEDRGCKVVIKNYRKDGTPFWNEIKLSPIRGEKGEVTHYVAYMNDISKHLETQRRLSHYEQILSVIDEPMALVSRDLCFIEVNDAYAKLLGMEKEYLRGKLTKDVLGEYYVRNDIEDKYSRVLQGQTVEFQSMYARNGRERYFAVSYYPLFNENGKVDCITVSGRDITKLVLAERALKQAQQMQKIILDTVPVRVVWKDINSVFLGCNWNFAQDAGMESPDDIIGRTDFDMPWKESAELYITDDKNVMESGKSKLGFEEPMEFPDGTKLWLRTSKVPLRDTEGKIIGVLGTYEDITESKNSEEAMLEREEQFRLFTEHAPAAIAMFDNQMRYITASQRWIADYGLKGQELRGRSHYEVFPEVPERWKEIHRRCLAGAIECNDEDRFVRADGRIQWVKWEIRPWHTSQGFIGGIIMFAEDITERKESEESLRGSESRYRELVQNANSAIIRWSRDGTITFFNEYAESFFGYRAEEVIGEHINILLPEQESTGEELSMLVDNIINKPKDYLNVINENVCRDGRRVWMAWTNNAIYDEQGQVNEILAIGSDITERKEAEEALRKSEQRMRLTFDNAGVGIIEVEGQDQIINVNNRICEILGYSREQMLKMNIHELTYHDDRELSDKLNAEIHSGLKDRFNYEKRYIRSDGTPIWVYVTVSAIRDSDGCWKGSVGTVQDITELKHAEESIKESEEFLKRVIDTVPSMIFIKDKESRFILVNKALAQTYGTTPDEIAGKSDADFNPSAGEVEHYRLDDQSVISTCSTKIIPIESVTHSNGEVHWYNTVKVPLMNPDGTCEMLLGVATDITERKEAEEALRENERRLKALMGNLPGMAYRCKNDENWTMEFISDGCKEVTEYSPKDVIGNRKLSYIDIVVPEDRRAVKLIVDRAIDKHGRFELNYRIKTKSGKLKWIWERGTGVFDNEGKLLALEGFMTDITQRKTTEQALTFRAGFESLLGNISREFITLSSREMESGIRAALESISLYIDVESAGLFEFHDENKLIWLLQEWHGEGIKIESIPNLPVGRYPSLIKKLQSRETIVLSDTGDLPTAGKESEPKFFEQYKSMIITPIVSAQRTAGFLILGTVTEKREWKDEVVTGVQLASNIFAQALERQSIDAARDKLTHELASKNSELESIIYVASHDLRSPLVNIQGFSYELKDSCARLRTGLIRSQVMDKIDKNLLDILGIEIPESLGYIVSSATKMDSLMQGLLRVSRLGRAELNIQTVDMNMLMSDVLRNEEYKIKQEQVTVNLETLPECLGDFEQLTQVFTNLIENAIKYRSYERPLILSINGYIENGFSVYWVEDNGKGIAPEHQGKIFEIFHRLEPGKTSGEGLGLTIVKRILDRHGGDIWIESQLDKGSKFLISLPR